MNQYISTSEEEVKEYLQRYPYLYIIVALVGFIFLLRLSYLQLIKGDELRYFSEKNLLKLEKIQAPRGRILDRNGVVLVDNLPGFEVLIIPQFATQLEKTADAISPILDITATNILKMVKKGRVQNGIYRPVRIKDNLSRDEVARLELLRLDHPGLKINMFIKRSYPYTETGAQLYGYVGEISKRLLPTLNKNRPEDKKFRQGDIIGKGGLESSFDEDLRGTDGMDFVQVDAFGRYANFRDSSILQSFQQRQESIAGRNLVLTIDADIQKAAYESMISNQRIGAVVALDPNNGEVLAWVNGPSFDPNEFATGVSQKVWSKLTNDPYKPLRNKVVQDHVPPGSTFKAITAIAALEEKVVNTNTTIHCPGKIKFGRKVYHCHLKHGHGAVNIFQALEQSCDVFFYRVSMQLGIDKIAKYAKALGMGKKTGIDIIGEIPGLVPTTQWKEDRIGEAWQPGENLSNSIGQGFLLATPLQMATVYAGLANNGLIYKPHLVKEILDSDNKKLWQAKFEVLKDNSKDEEAKISRATFDVINKGLWMVSNGDRGTAKWLKVPGIEMAGKTGTVQLFSLNADQVFARCDARPMKQRHHGWFVTYAPAAAPKIVVAVLAEHACSGSGGAGPIARDTVHAFMKKYYPDSLLQTKKPASLPAAAAVPGANSEE